MVNFAASECCNKRLQKLYDGSYLNRSGVGVYLEHFNV
jgi:hypothetical protein